MLVSGSNGFCSGALVNNVLNNGKPYVLTANHCYSNPATWIFRFNWQALNCPNPATSPSFQSLNGAVLRARASASDFCLVEITGGLQGGTVPVVYTPYFAGWDNSNTTPASAVCIHHPSGDIKKISFENDPLVSTSWGWGPANTHWGITNWDSGVTEPGSSGSPIFDQNHRVVGQLHGGASACGAAALSDEYGKFGYSWNPAGSDSTNQLKYWLDPSVSGALFIDGYDPAGGVAVQVDPGISNVQGVSGTYCSAEVTPSFSLVNNGAVTLTSAAISYGFDGVNNLIYNWSGILPQWQSIVVNLPTATLTNGAHTFSATVTNTNAGVDENNLNNAVNSSFLIVLNGVSVVMDLTLDCYGSETSWELQNTSGTTIYAGNGYQDDEPGMVSETWCLNYGCYSYVLMDSYGDGLSNNGLCDTGDGNLLISQAGDTLSSISTAAADFGDQVTLDFCLSGAALNELENNNMVIFPNPSNGVVMISLEHQTTGVFQVLTLTGQLIEEYDFIGQQFKMNLTVLSAGSYFIRFIEQGGNTSIKKLVLN
jgi:lysyl endopeptidase